MSTLIKPSLAALRLTIAASLIFPHRLLHMLRMHGLHAPIVS